MDSIPVLRVVFTAGATWRTRMVKSLTIVLFLFSGWSQAQEICNNGIDDDLDGYIDCFDSDCSAFAGCDSAFLGGPVPGCQFSPTPSAFSMAERWRTDATLYPMDNRQTPLVGDIDGDGFPEVIGRNVNLSNTLYIFDGVTGAHEMSINSPPSDVFLDAAVIGDIDNDGFGEIITVAEGNVSTRRLYCYEHTGAVKWVSNVPVGYSADDDRWTPALADFNQDGQSEVYLGNQIYNGATGVLVASAGVTASRGAHPNSPTEPFPVAADVLPSFTCPNCAGLELICGNTVYSVNVGTGAISPERVVGTFSDGPTSIVDLDQDGDLDAVVTGAAAGRGVVYAWDLQTTAQIGSTFQIDNATAAPVNTLAGGHCNVADFDGNGDPEIGLAGNDVYLVLDLAGNNLVELWSRTTNDASERTGSSVFDFEGDGANEVVYRDEDTLFVYNGATGATLTAVPCQASTRYDFPIVADVNGDGQTNIVCACATRILAFETNNVPWVSARQVFNQHSYFAVNVNDDLTIPQQQQAHHLGFPSSAPMSFPLNSFLTQATLYDFQGNPTFAVADDSISIVDPLNDMDYSGCQTGPDSIGASPTVYNNGDQIIPSGSSVGLYSGNPFQLGATFLTTITIPANIPIGGSLQLPMTYFPDQMGNFVLYLLVNDDGTNAIPLTAPATSHAECDLLNNLDSLVILACGNTPPVVDTNGNPTDTIFITLPEDSLITVCPNGTDAQGDTWDVVGVALNPSNGVVTAISTGDSCFAFNGNLNFNGMDTFSVIICDQANLPVCDTLTVIATITPVNDPPRAINDAATVQEDTPTSIPVQDNDSDVDGDPLTNIVYVNAQNGNATVNGDSILYTPNPDYTGPDTIQYVICDTGTPPLCDTAFIYIVVQNINDPPVGVVDTISVPNALPNNLVLPLANDTDIDGDSLQLTVLSGPSHGTIVQSGDSLFYTPDSAYLGLDTVVYVLCDNGTPPLCDTSLVIFNVNNDNVPPRANDDNETGVSGTAVNFDVTANDFDPNGQSIVVTSLPCTPQNGTATIDMTANQVVYTANAGYLGPDTLCYVICDVPPAGPPFCDTAFVYIEVISDNVQPLAVDDNVNVLTGVTTDIDILANDVDPNGDGLNITILVPPVNGTAQENAGQIAYTPSMNFIGVDSFQYEICDIPTAGPPLCDTAWVYITVDAGGISADNGFSPNNDGANDFLIIDGLAAFPNHRLTIFSRWGTTVYEATNYNNDWNGTRNGNPVPDGTYYWVVDPGDGSEPASGYVVIYR
ncbi:MAG: Ig-like domain-containing protein [Bacteroidota bacterium]